MLLYRLAQPRIDAISRKWRSSVYKHFKTPRIVLPATQDGSPIHRFVCASYVFHTARELHPR